jgi:OmpA family protein
VSTRLHLFLPLAAALVVAGCVTVPTGPAVMALPGSSKNFDAFRADDVSCREYAQYQLGPVAGQEGQNRAVANAAGGAALGAAAGAIIGSVSGNAGHGAAIGAGTGLLFGSAVGADAAGYTSYDLQRRYDAAYLQCMYAKGNQVPAGRRYSPRRYGPPVYGPPPDYVPPPAG